MALSNTRKMELRMTLYNRIKSLLSDEDIDFAVKGSSKTAVLNMPFVDGEEESWFEISVSIPTGSKDEAYEGYEAREAYSFHKEEQARKAKEKAEEKAKKIASDKAKREAKKKEKEVNGE